MSLLAKLSESFQLLFSLLRDKFVRVVSQIKCLTVYCLSCEITVSNLLVVIAILLNVIHYCEALLDLPPGSWFNKRTEVRLLSVRDLNSQLNFYHFQLLLNSVINTSCQMCMFMNAQKHTCKNVICDFNLC